MTVDSRIYGGYRAQLGPYMVYLDGKSYQFEGFQAGDTEDYNAVLFNSTELTEDYHQVELINIGDELTTRNVLDISHVILCQCFILNRKFRALQLVYKSNQVATTTIPSISDACQWGPRGQAEPVWWLDQSTQ